MQPAQPVQTGQTVQTVPLSVQCTICLRGLDPTRNDYDNILYKDGDSRPTSCIICARCRPGPECGPMFCYQCGVIPIEASHYIVIKYGQAPGSVTHRHFTHTTIYITCSSECRDRVWAVWGKYLNIV